MKALITHTSLLILALTLVSCGGKNAADTDSFLPGEITVSDNNGQVVITTPARDHILSEVIVLPAERPVTIIVISPEEITETIIIPETTYPDEVPGIVVEVTVPELIPVVVADPVAFPDAEVVLEDTIEATAPVSSAPVIEVVEVIDLKDLITEVEKARTDTTKVKDLRKKILHRIEVLEHRLKVTGKNSKKEDHFVTLRWQVEKETLLQMIITLDQY